MATTHRYDVIPKRPVVHPKDEWLLPEDDGETIVLPEKPMGRPSDKRQRYYDRVVDIFCRRIVVCLSTSARSWRDTRTLSRPASITRG